MWDELLEEVVEAGTLTTFKRHLDRYMDRKGLEGYGPNQANGVSLDGLFGRHGPVWAEGPLSMLYIL